MKNVGIYGKLLKRELQGRCAGRVFLDEKCWYLKKIVKEGITGEGVQEEFSLDEKCWYLREIVPWFVQKNMLRWLYIRIAFWGKYNICQFFCFVFNFIFSL